VSDMLPLSPPGASNPHLHAVVGFDFYMPHDHRELAVPVTRALDTFLHALGPEATGLSTAWDADGEPTPLTHAEWGALRARLATPGEEFMENLAQDSTWFQVLTHRRFDAHLVLAGDEAPSGPLEFRYRSRLPWRKPDAFAVSVLNIKVPLRILTARGPDALRALAMAVAEPLPFVTAHAGLSFVPSRRFWKALPGLKPELTRHPGWAIPLPGLAMDIGARIDGVHWLNFLGPPVLEALGGVRALRSRLVHPDTRVQELSSDRALISLGPAPLAGDLLQGDTLPAYRELARVLEPALLPFSPSDTWDGFTEDETRQWWCRFLVDPSTESPT
jgi:hypothetical protein